MRIAVIGTGIAGNAAAWTLSQRYPVTVYDRELRPGGASLFLGDVMHARLKPMGHRFSYRVMSLLIDLDRLNEANRQSALFGVNRAAIYSFHEEDHGPRDGSIAEGLCEALRQQQDKLFYVSPLVPMPMRYHFRVLPPSDTVKLRILESDRDGPLLAATFNGRRRLTSRALLRSFFACRS